MANQTTKRRRIATLDAAVDEVRAARAAVAALADERQRVADADRRLREAQQAMLTAASVDYLREVAQAALGLDDAMVMVRSGSRCWPKGQRGAALVFHADERGWLSMTGGGYEQQHGKADATVTCMMFGPTRAGFWYEANGRSHWHEVSRDSAKNLRFSLRWPCGRMQALARMSLVEKTADLR